MAIRVDAKNLHPSKRHCHGHDFDGTSDHWRVYTFYYSLVQDTPKVQEILHTATLCFYISLSIFAHSVRSLG